jgi:hypothetical protein
MRSATHHAPLSALLLSAVHPVTLYKHTQPSTSPLQAESCVIPSQRVQEHNFQLHPSSAAPSVLQRVRRALHTTVLVQQ